MSAGEVINPCGVGLDSMGRDANQQTTTTYGTAFVWLAEGTYTVSELQSVIRSIENLNKAAAKGLRQS
jgi:hypothetical protein